jgi:hypothetical protein
VWEGPTNFPMSRSRTGVWCKISSPRGRLSRFQQLANWDRPISKQPVARIRVIVRMFLFRFLLQQFHCTKKVREEYWINLITVIRLIIYTGSLFRMKYFLFLQLNPLIMEGTVLRVFFTSDHVTQFIFCICLSIADILNFKAHSWRPPPPFPNTANNAHF